MLSYRDSADGRLKSEALDPLELIRRWLLHVLPKGLVRVRHYGWLSPAAHKAFLRVRFLLGLGPIASRPPSAANRRAVRFCN
ncbi:MAG: transposase, partial [Terrimicrobiaceae bacterium]